MTTAPLRNLPTLDIRPIAGACGAIIAGLDLSQDLDDATVAAIRQAWLDHLVVFFPGQRLSPDRYMALARRFGRPIEYPFVKGIPGYPEIIEVLKREHERVNFGGIWHSDTTYLEVPPSGTFLHARELPPTGGDTIFANQYLAWETLSVGLRATLDGMFAISDSAKADVTRTREDRITEQAGGAAPKEKPRYTARHPVARTHPETGRKALYVNTAHTARFDGWTEAESKPVLDFLHQH